MNDGAAIDARCVEDALKIFRVQDQFQESAPRWRCIPTALTKQLDRDSVCLKLGIERDFQLLKQELVGTEARDRPSFGDAVFSPEPFAQGSFRKASEGTILLGTPMRAVSQHSHCRTWGGWQWELLPAFVDPKQGGAGGNALAKCVVKKFSVDPPGGVTQSSVADLRALHMAADLANKFNTDRDPPIHVHFLKGKLHKDQITRECINEVQEFLVDAESDYLNDVAKYHTDNVYLVEPKLNSFVKRNSNSGWVQKPSGWDAAHAVAQAFSHWTWCESDGSCLVCDLQGTRDLLLTDPVIHTTGRSTLTDLGELGICAFFKTHVCTSLCSDLKMPSEDFLSKYADVLPAVERTTYWFESVAVSAEVHDQKGGTCYANAAATCIRAALAKQGKEEHLVPQHSEIVEQMIIKYGMNGANLFDAFLEFCPKYNLCVREVEPAKAKDWVRKGHAVVASFHLTQQQWEAFNDFYDQSPSDVLFQLPCPKGKITIGHAAFVTGVSEKTLELKNSWGEDFADQGKFRVGIQALSLQYYHVFGDGELAEQDQTVMRKCAMGYHGSQDVQEDAVQAGRDREPEAIPAGMALVEMHGKHKRDTCQEIVSALYRLVRDGQNRSTNILAPKAYIAHVPEGDVQDLADAYSSKEFQQERRGYEEDAKKYNRTAGKTGKGRGARCARLRFFKRSGGEVFPQAHPQTDSEFFEYSLGMLLPDAAAVNSSSSSSRYAADVAVESSEPAGTCPLESSSVECSPGNLLID